MAAAVTGLSHLSVLNGTTLYRHIPSLTASYTTLITAMTRMNTNMNFSIKK